MLKPSRTKYRKTQRGSLRGLSKGNCFVALGEFGIQALTRGYITDRQIEAARIAITRNVKRSGKVYIRVFPDKPITSKPIQVRMGKGKGNVDGWVACVRPGQVLFEIEHVAESSACEALRLASAKLSVKTRFVRRVCKFR